MKSNTRNVRRFSNPTVLNTEAPFLGATVREWDRAITGDIDKTLNTIKLQAMGNGPKRDASKATTFDLASFVGRQLASVK
jgi:hypothetical protein